MKNEPSQVKEDSSAGFILCLIGGILVVLGGLFNLGLHFFLRPFIGTQAPADIAFGLGQVAEKLAPFSVRGVYLIFLPIIVGTIIIVLSFLMKRGSNLKVVSIVILGIATLFYVFRIIISTKFFSAVISPSFILILIGSILGIVKNSSETA